MWSWEETLKADNQSLDSRGQWSRHGSKQCFHADSHYKNTPHGWIVERNSKYFLLKIVIYEYEKTEMISRYLLFWCWDWRYSNGWRNAGHGMRIRTMCNTSNSLNTGKGRSKYVILLVHIYLYPHPDWTMYCNSKKNFNKIEKGYWQKHVSMVIFSLLIAIGEVSKWS